MSIVNVLKNVTSTVGVHWVVPTVLMLRTLRHWDSYFLDWPALVCPSLSWLARGRYNDLWFCIALTLSSTKRMVFPPLHYSSYSDRPAGVHAHCWLRNTISMASSDSRPQQGEKLATGFEPLNFLREWNIYWRFAIVLKNCYYFEYFKAS